MEEDEILTKKTFKERRGPLNDRLSDGWTERRAPSGRPAKRWMDQEEPCTSSLYLRNTTSKHNHCWIEKPAECMQGTALSKRVLGSGLVCSTHYDKLYSTCRIPGDKVDKLMKYGISKHIVVLVDGCIYKVMLCDKKNRIHSINQLAKIFTEVLSRKEKEHGSAGKVAALTVDARLN
ncbi:hypothetical protein DICVIV_02264 [Dictyocaulus viviparus]|uniref:Choline/carnitine acyltransferase domain-containing protein n=1 Tax=Dictyocaulus viviparus TaxID=29172 RepID=A0A0D8Y5Q3_DICVI|nr:hypothetical protein DICVIV_02264 [Dictyocaulus viviparus]